MLESATRFLAKAIIRNHVVKEPDGGKLCAFCHRGDNYDSVISHSDDCIVIIAKKYQAQPPTPPPVRKVCDACGDITDTGHTSFMCRLVNYFTKFSCVIK